jgi:TolB-like protein
LARELEGFEKLGSAPQAAVPTSKRLPVAGVVGVGLVAILAAIIAAWFTGDVQEWIAGDSSSPNIESIAVLPLDNLSGDPEQEYFADGMTEALTAALAKIGALKVISRTSAVRYKGSDKPLPEIARELGVDAIIEGSAMRVGDRVRITAQLIEAATDEHLWADSYERDLMNVLALQSDVARAVAQQIQIELTSQEEERLASAGPVDPEAHEAYLRGRVYESKVTAEGYQKAIALYEQALDRDPNHALAYAGIAESYLGLGVNIDALPDSEAMPLAREAAMKALEIDPTLAEAHALLGRISMLYDWNWAEAERQLAHALDLNPSSFSARRAYSRYLSVMGRGNEAIAEERRAQEIGPLEVGHMSMGLTYYLAREYDRALEELQRLLAKGGRARGAYLFLSLTYEQKEMWDEKIAADQKVLALSGFSPEEVAALGQAYAVSGVQGSWEWWLEFAKEKGFFGHSRVRLARAYMLTGDIDQTFRLLERGYEERDNDMLWLKVTPWFDPIRDDPRFQDLLRRMNFPES